ncbi:SDR family oxidoreductase [Aeromonas hydrophila]|uniref:UDP-glucose 4-epimerase family protein n=1 Tax=Aeromonas TaxID=642 RepID=UPI001B39F7CE|nr:SDR family oxidoreductase [Aeromonas hydrophila]MBQ4677658.1 NAD-dependent epimerase/dehydratase family protein [Aeromonas hydrophila]MBW3816262.1 NAD-dependent epimerase/dehydratase family protein [Aeromonas hydrophila]MCF7676580.1 SDR family oxidoreductase [Aeromonas hydrophila]MCF7773340.1 SDR family oxidoreductase [Aeromonas hydrophila]
MVDIKSTVLVTGAKGFVGKAVCEHLLALGANVKGAVRSHPLASYHVQAPSLTGDANWTAQLQQVDVVVHCAARVHVMSDTAADPLAAFRAVNTEATLTLARQAAESGVKRFIFISSIKVNGEQTEPGKPFDENVQSPPEDPYGRSKYEAEQGLMALAKECDMAVTIIRPPLIYGEGVKANFASMMAWVRKGVPLPFARLNNARSLLALPNLCDFIANAMEHPGAVNQVFLVADPIAVSTTQLLAAIADAEGVSCRLFYLPPRVIRGLGCCLGIDAKLQRIYGSLEMDTSKAQSRLQWSAPYSLSQTLSLMASSHSESS